MALQTPEVEGAERDDFLLAGRPIEDRSFEAVETVAAGACGLAIGGALGGPIGAAVGVLVGGVAGLTVGEAVERAMGRVARTTDAEEPTHITV